MTDSGHEIEIRCHHCAGPLTKNLETSDWTVAPFIRDSFSMIGSAVGGTASAFIGFNHGGTVPALAQLASSSYRAAVHSSQPPKTQEKNKIHKSTTSPL